MSYIEDNFLPISALQHLVFCPRQCALIHIEREWQENVLTAKGRVEHDRLDQGYRELRRGKKLISSVHVSSAELGLTGCIDVLELDLEDSKGPDNLKLFGLKSAWKAYPVEFKHGESKESDCDRVQLCAQALCLEEMFGINITGASLFYRRIRRREDVELTTALREKTVSSARELHELFNSGQTPQPVRDKRCKACSLNDVCMPKKMNRDHERYRRSLFQPLEVD